MTKPTYIKIKDIADESTIVFDDTAVDDALLVYIDQYEKGEHYSTAAMHLPHNSIPALIDSLKGTMRTWGHRGGAVNHILLELLDAEDLFPQWQTDLFRAKSILDEEVGEVAKALNDYEYKGAPLEDVITEVAQVGAMAIRMLEGLYELQKGGQ